MSNSFGRRRLSFLILPAAMSVILGAFRLRDQGNDGYGGFVTDVNSSVIRIDAGGPAERAGLKVGDQIRAVDGHPVEGARAQFERSRAGQSTALIVERPGRTRSDGSPDLLTVRFSYAFPPPYYAALTFAGFLIGLCFLLCALTACVRIPGRSGAILALASFCLGATFVGMPYFSSGWARALAQAILGLLLVFGFAFLFHLMLESPKPKSFLRRKHALVVLYGPAFLIASCIIALTVLRPAMTGVLMRATQILFGLFLVAYFGGAAAAMVHSYVKATALERRCYGLHLQLAGILAGVLPTVIEIVLGMIMPRLVLPGNDFYFLTIALIPISMLAALLKQHGGTRQLASQAG